MEHRYFVTFEKEMKVANLSLNDAITEFVQKNDKNLKSFINGINK